MTQPVSQARFIFLGTGTSGGIPLIACDCDTCTSTDPRDTRTRTAAAVQWIDPQGNPRCVLIDASPDLHQQARRHDLWRCDAILFTHNHVDHIFGIDEVRRFNAVMKAPISIYAEGYVLDALRRVYKHIFERDANINDSFVATLIAHEIPAPINGAGTPINLWGMRFTPIRLLHGRLPILGWRIEPEGTGRGTRHQALGTSKNNTTPSSPDPSPTGPRSLVPGPFPFAYCTDVSSIPPESWKHFDGLATLALDALRFRHHPTHFNIDQAIDAALRIGADQSYFIHVAHEVRHAITDPELPESIHLAYDGLTLGELDPAPFEADKQRMSASMKRHATPSAVRLEEG